MARNTATPAVLARFCARASLKWLVCGEEMAELCEA